MNFIVHENSRLVFGSLDVHEESNNFVRRNVFRRQTLTLETNYKVPCFIGSQAAKSKSNIEHIERIVSENLDMKFRVGAQFGKVQPGQSALYNIHGAAVKRHTFIQTVP